MMLSFKLQKLTNIIIVPANLGQVIGPNSYHRKYHRYRHKLSFFIHYSTFSNSYRVGSLLLPNWLITRYRYRNNIIGFYRSTIIYRTIVSVIDYR